MNDYIDLGEQIYGTSTRREMIELSERKFFVKTAGIFWYKRNYVFIPIQNFLPYKID